MLEKVWSNNSICRIIVKKNDNKEHIKEDNKEIIANQWNNIVNLSELQEYITRNNLNIILPNKSYKYMILQLNNENMEQKLLNKVLKFYAKKYNIDINEIFILYILSDVEVDFIYKIFYILNIKYILVTKSSIVSHLFSDNILQKHGEYVSLMNDNMYIMYTLPLSLILKNPTYISIFNQDISNFINI